MKIRTFARVKFPVAGIACRFIFALIITSGSGSLFAQLQRYPVLRDDGIQTQQKSAATARTQEQTLALPFWDDFSKTHMGLYPSVSLWDNSFSVWINNGMAVNAPTHMVATFDGLDSAGLAYNPQEIFLKGFTDSLISKPINLSEGGTKPVLAAERNSVYLSFFYQWKGNGEAPDREEDYLQVQFRNDQGEWLTTLTITPEETIQPDTFYAAIIRVEGDEFFHDAFQFRFRSFGRQSGPYDTWNVDYVYLNKDRTATDLAFPDRAIASPLGTFLGRYRSMPLRHFNADRQFTNAAFDVINLQKNPVSANYRARLDVYNYKDGAATAYTINLGDSIPLEYDGSVASGFLPALSRKHITTLPTPGTSSFHEGSDSIYFDARIILNSGDNVYDDNNSTGDYTENYEPIDFRTNDTIRSRYVLGSYYAYDDGVAEYAAGLIETGNLVAYEFEMPFDETFTQDTLVGFDIYFPPYGITSNQRVDFFIYRSDPDNDMPGQIWLRIPSRPVNRSGINTFQRIQFLPALLIDEKKFYIGWKEPVGGKLLVGLDVSNDTGDKMWVNTNNFWERNEIVTGSLMIRPVFGSGEVDTQVGIGEPSKDFIYPNPSAGQFFIEGHPGQIEILSSAGNRVTFETEHQEGRTRVQVNQPAGLYIIRYWNGYELTSAKIVIR